jgi:type VI protein secretion system component VasK
VSIDGPAPHHESIGTDSRPASVSATTPQTPGRFGPPWVLAGRIAATAVVTRAALWLAWRTVVIGESEEPRPAALALLLLGSLLLVSVPILRWLWQPTHAWKREQEKAAQAQRRLHDQQQRHERIQAARKQVETEEQQTGRPD